VEPDAEVIVDPFEVERALASAKHGIVPIGGRFLVAGNGGEALVDRNPGQPRLPLKGDGIGTAGRKMKDPANHRGQEEQDQPGPQGNFPDKYILAVEGERGGPFHGATFLGRDG
jgi:hypothetical protein